MKNIYILAFMVTMGCSQRHTPDLQEQLTSNQPKQSQDSILKEHLRHGAWKHPLYSRERDEEIDKGLAKDSTIAYLWQQKSMPMLKQGKYDLAMPYVDKAVKYDRLRWQPYRAYVKCIFAKTHMEAISDFEDCKAQWGNSVVMDHSYNFYIALCKIQLNQFKEAEEILQAEVNSQLEKYGEEWVHHLDLFYLGISQYEQRKYQEACESFNRALKLYPELSDAHYYKSICMKKLGNEEEVETILAMAKSYANQGFTFTEDGAVYERYPYQVRW